MATDRRNGGKRDCDGRFLPGNPGGPGRLKGSENSTTVAAKQLKAVIIEHALAEDCGKARIVVMLDRLAESDPTGYVRQVCSILPRDLGVSAEVNQQVTLSEMVARVNAEANAYEADLLKRFGKLPPEDV